MERITTTCRLPIDARAKLEQVARLHYENLNDVVIRAIETLWTLEGEPGKQVQKQECQAS